MINRLILEEADRAISGLDLSQLSGKKVLITGASGLLGTYFVASIDQWSKNKNQAVEVLGLCSSEPENWWTDLFNRKNFNWLRGDLSDQKFIESLPPVDFIIHAAGYGQPGKFLQDPVKTIELNTTATTQLFRKLKPDGKFLFISTSEVYVGCPDLNPDENQIGMTNTDWPRASYIEAKRTGEAICHAFQKEKKYSRIARLALGYGPGTKNGDQRALHSFIERAVFDGRIVLMDHGQAARTYCYITDAIEMLWNIFLHGKYTTYNVGGISKTTIGKLATMIGQLVSVPVDFPSELPKISVKTNGAPPDVSINISRYLNEFPKKAFVPLDEGLKKTIRWQNQFASKEKMRSRA